ELHGCTSPGDMHGFAIVGNARREERGNCDGYADYHSARFLAALSFAAICAADARVGNVGGVIRVACRTIDNLQLESYFSPKAWHCGDGRASSHFALHILLWRLRYAVGWRNALIGSAQPNQCQWRVFLNGHSDAERASPHWRRASTAHQRQGGG